MIKNIIFDLDGTLLPMRQSEFIESYFKLVVQKMLSFGVDADTTYKALWSGIKLMVKNDGKMTNCVVFWPEFCKLTGVKKSDVEPFFMKFYENEFNLAKSSCGFTPFSRKIIDELKQKGYRLILATNALFPLVALKTRLSWVDLAPQDFCCLTSYDVSSYCKPNLNYYREILQKQSLNASECLMVGNDVEEDMCTNELGLSTFLITDHLEHAEGKDISEYQKGSLEQFFNYTKQLPKL